MVKNRLKYETSAGNLSEKVTYSQLVEYLRLSAEAAYTLGHYKKANDDDVVGQGFLAIGQLLERVVTQVTQLATNGIRQ
jgi:hypothetical protein